MKVPDHNVFPSLLPQQLSTLMEHYTFRKAETARFARAMAINSFIERAGSDGCTTTRFGDIASSETGARAAALLTRMVATGKPLKKAFRQLPFLIPLPWQCTTIEPARSIPRAA